MVQIPCYAACMRGRRAPRARNRAAFSGALRSPRSAAPPLPARGEQPAALACDVEIVM
eukprot:SAG31_NODE_33742_length_340_cov_1.074689_1_plen_57_part_10